MVKHGLGYQQREYYENMHEKKCIFQTLEKAEALGDNEWIQQIIPFNNSCGVAIDSNRGLIFFDIVKQVKEIYYPNENWCIQDLLIC